MTEIKGDCCEKLCSRDLSTARRTRSVLYLSRIPRLWLFSVYQNKMCQTKSNNSRLCYPLHHFLLSLGIGNYDTLDVREQVRVCV